MLLALPQHDHERAVFRVLRARVLARLERVLGRLHQEAAGQEPVLRRARQHGRQDRRDNAGPGRGLVWPPASFAFESFVVLLLRALASRRDVEIPAIGDW